MPRSLESLAPFDEDGRIRVVVEATAGTRSKLKYNPKIGAMELHHVVPAGTSFPLDFGFMPGTLGEDGDPLDALLFADEPTPPGVVVAARLIGVLPGTQAEKGKKKAVRNDRFLAVADSSHTYSHWHDLADVPAKLLDELETFFVSYNAQRGIRYQPEPRAGRKAALARMRKGTVR